jgi:hypothetical protein
MMEALRRGADTEDGMEWTEDGTDVEEGAEYNTSSTTSSVDSSAEISASRRSRAEPLSARGAQPPALMGERRGSLEGT